MDHSNNNKRLFQTIINETKKIFNFNFHDNIKIAFYFLLPWQHLHSKSFQYESFNYYNEKTIVSNKWELISNYTFRLFLFCFYITSKQVWPILIIIITNSINVLWMFTERNKMTYQLFHVLCNDGNKNHFHHSTNFTLRNFNENTYFLNIFSKSKIFTQLFFKNKNKIVSLLSLTWRKLFIAHQSSSDLNL